MAEAVAAVGLIAAIASLVDIGARCVTKLKECDTHSNSRTSLFQDVRNQLPLILETVEDIKSNSEISSLSKTTEQNLVTAVNGCKRQIDEINELVDRYVILPGDSSIKRARKAFGCARNESKLMQAWNNLESYKSTIAGHASRIPRYPSAPTKTSRLYHIPSRRVAKFVGRSELLLQLSEYLQPPASSIGDSKLAVLSAMGGQGKTQIALEYCRQAFNERAFDNVLWLDASSENMLIRSYCALGDAMSLFSNALLDEVSKARLARSAVEKLEGSCLFVYDNFDRPDIFQNIRDYFPVRCDSSFLFTSRHLEAERLGRVMLVPPMTDDESITLLLQRAQIERSEQTTETARGITKKLGHHPLALDQAGSYVYFRRIPLETFLERFNQRKREVLNYTPALWEYRRALGELDTESALSACTTFEMSLDQAAESTSVVVELLTIAAFMNSTSVDEEILRQVPRVAECLRFFTVDGTYESWDSCKFADVVTSLCTVSLVETVSLQPCGVVFSLHPLIKDWLRIRLQPSELVTTTRKVIDLLTSAVNAFTDVYMDFHVRASIAAHMDAYLELEKEIGDSSSDIYNFDHSACVFGSVYNAHGRFQDAVNVFKNLFLRQKANGKDCTSTMLNMANAIRNLARFDEAAELYSFVYEERKKVLPEDAAEVSRALEGLAFVHSASGKLEQADEEFRSLLKQREKHPKKLVIGTSRVVEGIASIRRYQGRLIEAEALFARALATRIENIRPDRMETMRALEGLAIVYRNQGRVSEAVHIYGFTLEIVQKQVGTEHSRYGRALYNKALAILHQGKFSIAEPMAIQAHQCLLACFGAEDDHVKQAAKLVQEVEAFKPPLTSPIFSVSSNLGIMPDLEEKFHPSKISSDEIMTLARLDGFPPSYLDDPKTSLKLRHFENQSESMQAPVPKYYQPHTMLYDGHVIQGTPIEVFTAAGADYVHTIELLKANYNLGPDVPDSEGCTPLARAARDGHVDLVALLLARDDVRFDSRDERWGRTPLMHAARNGHLSAVKLLHEKYDQAMIDARDLLDRTAIVHARIKRHSEIVEYLTGNVKNNPDEGQAIGAGPEDCKTAVDWVGVTNLNLGKDDKKSSVLLDLPSFEATEYQDKADFNRPPAVLETA